MASRTLVKHGTALPHGATVGGLWHRALVAKQGCASAVAHACHAASYCSISIREFPRRVDYTAAPGCQRLLSSAQQQPQSCWGALMNAATKRSACRRCRHRRRAALHIAASSKRELLVGDVTCLVCFALYKQITAIMLLPTFPGLLAPLRFNPVRFEEFASFATTLCGTWVGVALLLGAYSRDSTADVQTAAWRAFQTWLCSMPVAAAQLVLVTAAEDRTLVGAEGFASALPLAASGPGEPFTTAAGVLGVMAVWRCFYTAYLDIWSWRMPSGARVDRERDGAIFAEALRGAALLAACFAAAVWLLFQSIDEATAEDALAMLFR